MNRHQTHQASRSANRQHRGALELKPGLTRHRFEVVVGLHPGQATHPKTLPSHQPFDAFSRHGAGLAGRKNRQLQAMGLLLDRIGQGMAGTRLQAGGQLHHPLGCCSPKRVDLGHQGPTHGEGAGFIEQHRPQPGGRLNRIAAPEQQARTGRQPRTHRHGRGRGQTQGAGTGHHQHRNGQLQGQSEGGIGARSEHPMGHGAHLMGNLTLQHLGPEARSPLPPEDKRGDGQGQNKQGEAPRHPIHQPLNRGLTGLGLLHQMDDPGNGAVAARAPHLELQRGLQIEAARRQFHAHFGLQGQGFAGEARHIHRRGSSQHHPIHRHPIPRKQLHPVPRPQAPHPHLARRAPIHQQQGRIRFQGSQLLEGTAGAKPGPIF